MRASSTTPYRHRFTVRYLEGVLRGSWKADSPASPHKLLNAFVENMAEFTPPDGDESILAQEEVPHLIEFKFPLLTGVSFGEASLIISLDGTKYVTLL